MKKSIKLLICILIAVMIIPVKIYGYETPDHEDIAKYWKEAKEFFKNVNVDEMASNPIKYDEMFLERKGDSIRWHYASYYIPYGHVDGCKSDEDKKLAEKVYKILDAILNAHNFFSNKNNQSNYTIYKNLLHAMYGTMNHKTHKRDYTMYEDNTLEYLVKTIHKNGKTGDILVDELVETFKNELIEELKKRDIDVNLYNFEGIESENIDFWKPVGGSDNGHLIGKTEKILGLIQIIGSIASVLALIVIGIKYMLGSVEEKAKYKETMIPYIIGCILLFGATNIASILCKIGMSINS